MINADIKGKITTGKLLPAWQYWMSFSTSPISLLNSRFRMTMIKRERSNQIKTTSTAPRPKKIQEQPFFSTFIMVNTKNQSKEFFTVHVQISCFFFPFRR